MHQFKRVFQSLLSALLMSAVLGCAGNTQRETSGYSVDDSWITSKIKAAFVEDKTLDAPEINIETYKGAVQLSGVVSDLVDVEHAATVALGVKGVTSVENNIQVK
ncbi:MAG: BON domain-containing protein [Prolixibacteraceae bacterium]|nr:BON domain-containing protein [Burkholderiales bacterium]